MRAKIRDTEIYFDIEWDGSTRTQFSMSQFPTDGTYIVKFKNGEKVNITVEKQGKIFTFEGDRGFRGKVKFH